jgi:lysophospholipase L1-like esterase
MKTSEEMFLEKIAHGFAEIVKDDDGSFRLFRVPCALLPKLGARVNIRCYHPAGGELRFRMKDTPVSFTLRRITEPDSKIHDATSVIPVGIFHGDYQYAWRMLNDGDTKITVMPFPDASGILHRNRYRFNPDLTRIILPPFVEVRVIDWEGEMEPPQPEDVPDVQLLSYGSSITQGGCASHAGNDYVSMLSRWLHFDYINLGFSGNAKAEQKMAEYIASLDMQAFVYDYDHNAPSLEHLQATHAPMYEIIRQKHPNMPILIMSKPDFQYACEGNAKRRAIIYATYEKPQARGDNVAFIDGETLFGEDWDMCTVDRCHPNDLGFYKMAQRVAPVLEKMLIKEVKS